MRSTNMTIAFSGHSNQGFQLGTNSGHVHNSFNIYGRHPGSLEGPPTKLNPSSNVPFRRDPDFVDGDILAEIGKKCSKPASRTALVGLGGVGKSQLAIEYSYRIKEQSPQTWIFWVHAGNTTRFEEGYRMIAERIKLPRRDDPTADVLRLVSNWLCDEANGQWVIILDNADDPIMFSDPHKGRVNSNIDDFVGGTVSLSNFLPQTPNGSILVTSRSKDAALSLTGSHHDIIEVEPMDKDRALLLFRTKLRGGFDRGDAMELIRTLDYMPLAISQAAAHISQRAPRTTVATYLDAFRKSDWNRANLLSRDAGDLRRDKKASNSIITTWQISFEYIRGKWPSAARLLSLMSFFDRQGIPKFLLQCYNDGEDGSNIDLKDRGHKNLEDNDMKFEDDVCTLTSYSLITTNVRDSQHDQFEMHGLVQFSTRKWLEMNGELEKWEKKYIRIISKAFPRGDYTNWKICQLLFPHAEAVLAYRPAEKKYLIYWSDVLNRAGWYAQTQGTYLMAEEMHRQALDAREEALGEEHLDTLVSVSNLAVVLQYRGKYEAAEEMNRRALDGRWKVLGKEHPNTLVSFSNLALVLAYQGKYEAAEKMSRRALDGSEKVLGKEHPYTLASVSNLARVLHEQAKYEAAEVMNRRVLDGREKTLGREHPDTLMSVSNLALVLAYRGKYEAAEKMSRRALDGSEKVLGKEHPNTLVSFSNLALMLAYQGKYDVAENMSRRALDGSEKVLGKEHPDTLVSVSNLAVVLKYQGKYEAAEEMNLRVLDGREKTLGKKHPDTLASLNNLAVVLRYQGKCEAAEKMNRRALDEFEKALGMDHPYTLMSVYCLAHLLHQRKQYKDAETLYERSCAGFQKALGINNPVTVACSQHYSCMIDEMISYRESECTVM